MQVMRYDFRLFGPRAGQTISVNGHKFVDGECRIVQSKQNMEACVRVLSFYGAYHRGSDEYDTAIIAEGGNRDGIDDADPQALEGADAPVRGEVRQAGEESPAPAAVLGEGAVDPSGSSGSSAGASGHGHEHAGVPVFPEDADRRFEEPPSEVNEVIKEAVLKLDPQVDDHWVKAGAAAGKPKLAAVEEAYGKAGLTRNDVEAALPGWDRDKAVDRLLNE